MDRAGLKNWAKNAFHRSYWKSVLVAFILTITAGAGASSSSSGGSSSSSGSTGSMSSEEAAVAAIVVLIVLAVVFVISIVAALLKAFVFNPLQVGCQAYFCDGLYNPNPSLNDLGKGFKSNYKNVIKTMFFRDLYLFLWSLISVIPVAITAVIAVVLAMSSVNEAWIGVVIVLMVLVMIPCMIPSIIKTYEYMLIPYIMAENPNMPTKDAFALTKHMMMGDKFNAWVLQLSFIGWNLLSLCTCGILSIFYVAPYQAYTMAAFYKAMQQKVRPQIQPVVQPEIGGVYNG